MEKTLSKETEIGKRLGRLFTYLAGNEPELKELIEKLDKDLQHFTFMHDIQKEFNIIEWEEYLEGVDLAEYHAVIELVNAYSEMDVGEQIVDGYLKGRGLRRTRKPNW